MDIAAIFGTDPAESIELVVAMPAQPNIMPGWSSWIETRADGSTWYVEELDDAQVVSWEDGVPWD